jgi:hypothetical protein
LPLDAEMKEKLDLVPRYTSCLTAQELGIC